MLLARPITGRLHSAATRPGRPTRARTRPADQAGSIAAAAAAIRSARPSKLARPTTGLSIAGLCCRSWLPVTDTRRPADNRAGSIPGIPTRWPWCRSRAVARPITGRLHCRYSTSPTGSTRLRHSPADHRPAPLQRARHRRDPPHDPGRPGQSSANSIAVSPTGCPGRLPRSLARPITLPAPLQRDRRVGGRLFRVDSPG